MGSGEPCPGGQEKGGDAGLEFRERTNLNGCRDTEHGAAGMARVMERTEGAEPEELALEGLALAQRWNGKGYTPPGKSKRTKTCIGGQRLRLPVTFVRGNGEQSDWRPAFRDVPGSTNLQGEFSTAANAAVGAAPPPRRGGRPALLQASGPPGRAAGCGPGGRWRPLAPDPAAAGRGPTRLR